MGVCPSLIRLGGSPLQYLSYPRRRMLTDLIAVGVVSQACGRRSQYIRRFSKNCKARHRRRGDCPLPLLIHRWEHCRGSLVCILGGSRFSIFSNDRWRLEGHHAGKVPLDMHDSPYLGAQTATSGAAELAAQTWAMMVATEYVAKHGTRQVAVRYDSEFAAGFCWLSIKAASIL